MLNKPYTEKRSSYHWVLAVGLALAGVQGYGLITALTQQAETAEATAVTLTLAPFLLPGALLAALVPLVVEVLHRSRIKSLSERGFLLTLLLIPLIALGWAEFSRQRFEHWLGGLDYSYCEAQSTSAAAVWSRAGHCE